MFAFQTALVLNRFRNAAQISAGLSDGKNEKDDGAADRQRRDESEDDRRQYVERRLREIRRFERRANGEGD